MGSDGHPFIFDVAGYFMQVCKVNSHNLQSWTQVIRQNFNILERITVGQVQVPLALTLLVLGGN